MGLVVSYGGNGFRLSAFTKLFTKAVRVLLKISNMN